MARPHKGQHKVPRIYLQAFTDAAGLLWVSDNKLKIYHSKPQNVLTEKDFYTVRFPSGQGSLVIETEVLGGIEAAYAKIYREKISQFKRLTPEEKATMSIFLASMLERGPRIREAMQDFYGRVVDRMDRMMETVEKMTEEEKKAYADAQPLSGDPENVIPGDVMREWAKDVPSLHSSGIPHLIVGTAPIINDMKWNYMVRPKGAAPFLTSDNPAILVNPNLPPRSIYGPGLAQKMVELSLPLSPEITLLAGWQMNQDGYYMRVGSESVDEINRRTMRYGETLVSNEREILEVQVKRIKDYLDKHRMPSEPRTA